jgi:hypothetical protein
VPWPVLLVFLRSETTKKVAGDEEPDSWEVLYTRVSDRNAAGRVNPLITTFG